MNFCQKRTRVLPLEVWKVGKDEKYSRKSYLYWGFSGIAEVKGLYLMGRGWRVPSGTESATPQWKELMCSIWEESLKTGSELLFLFLIQDFTCRKACLTWPSSFSSKGCLFLLSFRLLCTWSSHSCPISLCILLASAAQAKLPLSLQSIAFEVSLPVLGFWWSLRWLQQRTVLVQPIKFVQKLIMPMCQYTNGKKKSNLAPYFIIGISLLFWAS